MKLCKDCEYFHIRCEYENPYEWGEAICEKHNLITDFRSKKKFETLSCVEDNTQKGGKNEYASHINSTADDSDCQIQLVSGEFNHPTIRN